MEEARALPHSCDVASTVEITAGTKGPRLPADFLIEPGVVVRALKYGAHADNQWCVDEALLLAEGGPVQ